MPLNYADKFHRLVLSDNISLDTVIVIGEHTFAPQPNRFIPLDGDSPEDEFYNHSIVISSKQKTYDLEYSRLRLETISDLINENILTKKVTTIPLLKKHPTLKTSIDIQSKKFKTGSVKIELVNSKYDGYNLSEIFNIKNVTNLMCSVYIVTNASKMLSAGGQPANVLDCDLLVQQRISRYTHDKESVTIELEDLTETYLKKQILNEAYIPEGYKFPSEGVYRSNQRGRFSPIIYGDWGEDYVPYNLDEQFVLRADRFWDSDFRESLPIIDTENINNPGNTIKKSWIYLLDKESFSYTGIVQFGIDDGIEDDSDDIVDMTDAPQYFYIESGLINGPGLQMFGFSQMELESYVDAGEYQLNVDQMQQLSKGIYQTVPSLEFSQIIQRADEVQDTNQHRQEKLIANFNSQSVETPYNFEDTDFNYWTDIRKDDVSIIDEEWENNKKIKWDGPLTLGMSWHGPQVSALKTSEGAEVDGKVNFVDCDFNMGFIWNCHTCTRSGYSVILPIAGVASSIASGVTVKYKIKIDYIGPETQSNPLIDNIAAHVSEGMTTSNLTPYLAPGTQYVPGSGGTFNYNDEIEFDRSIRFGMRGINPWDVTDYEGRDLYYGGGNPEQSTSGEAWYAHYENLIQLVESGSFVGEGTSPAYSIGDEVFTNASPAFTDNSYEGTYIYTVNKFLGSWVDNPWPALEIEITPRHWGAGECLNFGGSVSQARDYLEGNFNSFDPDYWVYDPANNQGVDHISNLYPSGQVFSIEQPVSIEIYDFEIEAVSYLSGVHNKPFYVNGVKGRTISGYDDNHVIGQLADLWLNEAVTENILGLSELEPAEAINATSFQNQINNLSFYRTRAYIDRPQEFQKFTSELLANTPFIYFFNDHSQFSVDSIKLTYDISDVDLELRDVDILSIKFNRTPIEDSSLNVNIQYRYEVGRRIYLAETGYLGFNDVFDYEDDTIYGMPVEKAKEQYKSNITNKYISDEESALFARQFELMWKYNQHNIVEAELSHKYIGRVGIGVIISFYNLRATDNVKPYGENVTIMGLTADGPTIRNNQQIYPFFYVTDVTVGVGTVKIKAIQLHDMSFSQDPIEIYGCMDPEANNYNEAATVEIPGTCTYDTYGCTDPAALNYNSSATADNGTCAYPPGEIEGCMDPLARNYNPYATNDDGSCVYIGGGGGQRSIDVFQNDRHMIVDEAPYGSGVNSEFDKGLGIPIVPMFDINYEMAVDIDAVQNMLLSVVPSGSIDYNDPIIKQLDANWDYEIDETDLAIAASYAAMLNDFDFELTEQQLFLFIQSDYMQTRPQSPIPMGQGAVYMSLLFSQGYMGIPIDETYTNVPDGDYKIKDNNSVETALYLEIPRRAYHGMQSWIASELSGTYNSYEDLYQEIFNAREGDFYWVPLMVRTTEPFTIQEQIGRPVPGGYEWSNSPQNDMDRPWIRLGPAIFTNKSHYDTTDSINTWVYNSNSTSEQLNGSTVFNDGDDNTPYTIFWIKINKDDYIYPYEFNHEYNETSFHSGSPNGGSINVHRMATGHQDNPKDFGLAFRLIFTGQETGQQIVKYINVTYHHNYWGPDFHDYWGYSNPANQNPPPEPEDWAEQMESDPHGFFAGFFGGDPVPEDGD